MPQIPYDNYGCSSTETLYFRNYALSPQPNLPICYVSPSCELDITGTTITNCQTRGSSDGEIHAEVASTGATITWYINGVEDTTGTAVTHDFTGLTTGYYQISAEEGDCFAQEDSLHVLDGEFRTGSMQLTQAKDLTCSENPIIYEIRTAIAGVGAQAQVQITIDDDIYNNEYIQFELTAPYAYSQTFYSKGFPNKTNFFLSSQLTDSEGISVGVNSRAEIAQSLADSLQSDVLIPKVYTVNYDGSTTINLTAKQVGSRFALTNNNVTMGVTGATLTLINAGANAFDGQQVDGYSIYTELFLNNNALQYPNEGSTANYVRIAELELPMANNNVHRFDLAPILKNFVASSRPRFDATGSTVQPEMLKSYFIRFGERYPLVSGTNTRKKRFKGNTNTKWVINSALNHYSINNMSSYLGDFTHDVKSGFGLSFNWGAKTYNTVPMTFSDYLRSTGKTTDIQFKVVDNVNSTTYDWQTGSTFTLTGRTSYPYNGGGTVYISGDTSGDTFQYSRGFNFYCAYNYGTVFGDQDFETLSNVLFLTNAPDPKQIQRNSQSYLYFILKSGYDATLDVRGDLDFYDGSSVTGITFFQIQSFSGNSAGGVMALNISYDKLGLAAYETGVTTTRKIKNATFAIWQTPSGGTASQYSDHRAFRFEIEDRPRKFGIVFNNVLGGWDSFDFVGIVEQTINRTSGSYTVPIAYNTDGSAGEGFKSTASYNTKVLNKIIVNSGWLSESHFDWLKELMKSNDIYSYTTANQNYLNLDAFKYQKDSLTDLYEIECTFTQTIYENSIDV